LIILDTENSKKNLIINNPNIDAFLEAAEV